MFTVDSLCAEISKTFHQSDFTSNSSMRAEKSFQILRLLLSCSSHKLRAAYSRRPSDQVCMFHSLACWGIWLVLLGVIWLVLLGVIWLVLLGVIWLVLLTSRLVDGVVAQNYFLVNIELISGIYL